MPAQLSVGAGRGWTISLVLTVAKTR